MKLHRSLVQAVIAALESIFQENVYADKAVEQVLKSNPKWGSRDRRFIAETIYNLVRWKRLIEYSLNKDSGEELNLWQMIAAWFILQSHELPDWEEWRSIDPEKISENYRAALSIRKYRESFPDWLDRRFVAELGEASAETEMAASNQEAPVVLRVNTLLCSVTKLKEELLLRQIETSHVPLFPDALVLKKRQQLAQLDLYRQGYFEIQDASSQLIAANMDLQAGQTVIDACAGAGGKSLHAAALMHNKGRLIAMDIEPRKLIELERRSQRAKVSIIETRPVVATSIEKLKGQADRLLLDVPCSGLGVLKRNPDAKWKLTESFLETIRETQRHILADYSTMLKPGGIMVYATCSILPSENQDQVQQFLREHSEFELLAEKKILPSQGFDGFYLAKMKRKA